MSSRCGAEPSSERVAPSLVYVVLVADPVTGELDAFGPFDETLARAEVTRRRSELDAEDLRDVTVTPVVLLPPG